MIEQTCDKCGLCQTRTSVVPSLVPETTEVLFVLSFPGEAEDLEGKGPFVGNVGKFLNDLLYSIGLTRTDPRLGFTYAVRCRPKETNEEKIRQGRRDRLPSDIELKACSDYLEQEISSLSNLKLIVCLGSTASKRIIGSTGAQYDSLIGKVVNTLYAKALFMFHPSKLSSTTSHKERAELEAKASTAMSYVKGVLQGVVQKPLRKPVTYRVIRNVEQAKWLFDKLSSSEVFSFDLETSALDFLESHVLCISLSFKEQTGYVLPFYKQYLVPFWDSDEDYNFIYSGIKSILENSSLKKIGHNGKFDILHLRSFGINVKGYYFDTMLMHFALDENSSHGLKELSWSYTDMGGYDDELEEIRNKIKEERGISYREVSFDLLPEEKMWEYAAADADVTLRLFNIFFPRLKEENLLDLYSVYYRPMVEMLSDIEYRGITIDLEYLDSAITFYEDKVKALESQLLEDPYIKEYIEEKREVYRAERAKKWEISKTLSRRYSVKDYCEIGIDSITFNSNSPKQLIEFFIHKMKQPILATTEKNSPSINNEVLKVYAKKLPVASILSSKNQASHILGTSLEGMKKRLRRDNKLHTSFNMHVAVTARLSSTDPNLQNVPNKGRFPEDSERVRNIFVADPDCFILEADYGQIEFRMWAQLSQDPALYKDLRDGLDVHTKFAAMGFNIPESEVTKPLRNTAKNVVFGTMYGRSPESVAEELEISNREAISIQKALFNRYPQAVKWINVSKASAKRDGYVTGFFGQRRRLAQQLSDARRFIRSEAERQSVNSPIQGSSSQMTCVAAIKIFQGIRESNFNPSTRILLLIHDSIVLNIHKNDAKECLDLVERCMLNPHPGVTVPLTVGMNYSVRWGKAKELSKDEIFECVKRDFTI